LEVVDIGRRSIPPDPYSFVYRASTKELVGAFYATDTDHFACGSRRVAAIRGGTFPTTACTHVATTICAADAGAPRDASSDGD
jgi:hypothetical protein